MSERERDLAENLRAVQDEINRACDAANRAHDVTLVAVTKTYPASDIRILYDLGVRAVGENKDQEAKAKAAELVDLDLEWHFIGQLQRNKAKSVASYCSVVESLDRPQLAHALGAVGTPIDVLVQISLDAPDTQNRGGVRSDDLPELLEVIDGEHALRLRGVMGVAPLGDDPADAFRRLAEAHRRVLDGHPEATWISAGMSHDLQWAIAAGATHVRIGTALLGERRYDR